VKNNIIMKKSTLILVAFLFGMATNAQLQVEDFSGNSIPEAWNSENVSSGCDWQYGYTGTMPQSGSPSASFPSGAVLFDDSLCGNLSNDRISLTAPTINLSGVTNAEIVVTYNLQVFGNKGEFIVEVFDGSNWVEVFLQDIDSPRNTGTNESKTIDVSAFVNNAFAARFIYNDEGGSTWGLGIDNYVLNNNSVAGIEDLADFKFKYYPNPVTNMLKLSSRENIEKINIYNILGQEVMIQNPSKGYAQVDMSSLPIGVYVAHIQIESRTGSVKILKQ
jgi:hypothetical protein